MKNQRVGRNSSQGAACKLLLEVQVAAMGLLLVTALPLLAQDKQGSDTIGTGKGDSIGFVASKGAEAKDVGLPLYPGARPHREKSEDSPALQLGLWGHTWGFKLAVLKLESNDPPEKITTYYRKALATYGKVLNCADTPKAAEGNGKTPAANELGCQDDHPDNGETLLKAGTKEKQHIVSVKPEGGVTIFQLVYLETPPPDDKK